MAAEECIGCKECVEWEEVRVDGEDGEGGEHGGEERREQRVVCTPSGGPVCSALGLVWGCGWKLVSLHCAHR